MDTQQFEELLKSIGGLINCRKNDKPTIYSRGICECDDGWLQMIADLITELIDAGWNKEIRQVKEKFAGLCFYTNELPEGGGNIIVRYMRLSFQICEVCGSRENVKVRGKRWIKTLCEDHAHFAKN